MKRMIVVLLLLVGSAWPALTQTTLAAKYPIPMQPITLQTDASRQAIVSAKKVIVLAIAKPAVTSTWSGNKVRITEHGGVKRRVDDKKAKTELENALRKWGRFELVATPAEADLVFVILDESAPPSKFTQSVVKDSQYRLKDTIAVFRGGDPQDGEEQPLWAATASENTFSVFSGSLSEKIINSLREDLAHTEQQATK